MVDEEAQEARDTDAEWVEMVVGQWENWKDARADKEVTWQACINNYLVNIDESRYDQWPWRCKVADTFSQETGDTITSALRNALFPMSEDFFELMAEDEIAGKYLEAMQRYVMTHVTKLKFMERISPALKQICVIGNAPILAPWQEQTVQRRARQRSTNMETGKQTVGVQDISRTLYAGPGCDVLDMFDVVFEPTQLGWPSSAKIRRCVLPLPIAKQHYSKFDWSVLEEASGLPSEPSDTLKASRAEVFGIQDEVATQNAMNVEVDEGMVEVLEMTGDCVCMDELYEDWSCVVLNRKYLIESKRNTYWGGTPLFIGTYDAMWFTPFGRGPLEPIRGTQELIDTFTNQKADILNLIINSCNLYQDDGVFDPETAVQRPGGWIEVGNIANVKPLSPNANVALAFQEIEMLRARGERSSGASRMSMGQMSGGRRTAYEANLVSQGSSGRAMDVTKHLANDFLEPYLQFFVESIQQFKWDAKDRPKDLPQEALLGRYRVNYLGADMTAMRQFQLQQFTMMLDIVSRNPSLSMALNPVELMNELRTLFTFKNKNVVRTQAEYEQAVAQQQAQQMQMQAAAANQPGQGEMGPGMPQPETADMAMANGSPM